jgi:hypothetical protein
MGTGVPVSPAERSLARKRTVSFDDGLARIVGSGVFERAEARLREPIDSPNPAPAGSRDGNAGRPRALDDQSLRGAGDDGGQGGLREGGEAARPLSWPCIKRAAGQRLSLNVYYMFT